MEDGRSRARSCAKELATAWVAGDYDGVSDVCTSDVRWWTPLSGEDVGGRADARTELDRVLRALPRPIEVTAVLANDDGTRCVLEMKAPADAPDGSPAFVTSVLSLASGLVSAGRTYVDIGSDRRAGTETA
jgi:ketosteroid isomerase-like protein